MKGLGDFKEAIEDVEPDREMSCPNCNGTLAVWVEQKEFRDREGEVIAVDCRVVAMVHQEPEEEENE